MRRTDRGFGVFTEFHDAGGSTVRVIESSETGVRRVYVFASGGRGLSARQRTLNQECRDRKYMMPGDEIINDDTAACLSPAQARRLAKALLRFADGGRR